MSIKNLLLERAEIENQKNMDEFLNALGITEAHLILKLVFLKENWTSEEQAREWVKDKCLLAWNAKWTNEETQYVYNRVNEKQFKEVALIELRPGVHATIGIFDAEKSDVLFSSKDSYSVDLNSDVFQESAPTLIQVAKAVKGYHPAYGEIEITKDHLKSFKVNFDNKVTDIDLAVNEDHTKKEAFGWYKEVLFLNDDEENLFAVIDWNTKGTQALSEKEYRYFSPEFHWNWQHPLKKIVYGPTLLGGALTNYPFLRMDAITQFNNKPNQGENVSTIELSAHEKIVGEVNAKVTKLEVSLSAMEKENKDLNDKLAKIEQEAALKERMQKNQSLFDQGKINAAQLTLLNDGKDLFEVLSLNGKMNTEAQGAGKDQNTKELNADEKKFAASFGVDETKL